MSKADEAFARDVPDEKQQEDILLLISECIWDNESRDACYLADREMINAANYRGHGIITIGDKEHEFIAESGNNNGFVLESWDDGKVYEVRPVTRWTLQPISRLVSSAMLAGNGPFLVLKWDIFLGRDYIQEIIRGYAYDRMVQPGGMVENHYRAKAAKWKFEIVDQETADETRARLQKATEPLPPIPEGFLG